MLPRATGDRGQSQQPVQNYLYLATTPDLPNLLVAGDTPEEVSTLAPQVASALITSMQASGDPLPDTLRAN